MKCILLPPRLPPGEKKQIDYRCNAILLLRLDKSADQIFIKKIGKVLLRK
jgi:hypothetical protein